jgi:flagellin-like protein
MLKNRQSVSPVVGILMMVAITVILVTLLFKVSNVYFQSAPNVVLDVELYTIDNANATKVVIRDLGGDPIYFKNKRTLIYLNGGSFTI